MTVDAPMDPLERALIDLGSRVEIADVDAFTAATMERVRRGRDDARRRRMFSVVRGSHRRQLLAVAAAIVVVASALLAVPRSRDAIADLLGIDGLRIRSEQTPPTSVNLTTTAPSSTSATGSTVPSTTDSGAFDVVAVGRDLKLGSPVSLAAARTALPALRELASTYGAPDAIYLGDRPAGLVSFVWRARPELSGSSTAPSVGLIVQEYPSSGSSDFFLKTVSGGSRVREVVVEGNRGYWIDGDPHSLAYIDASGNFIQDTVRWASNALVWTNKGLTYRIESALTQDRASALVPLLH